MPRTRRREHPAGRAGKNGGNGADSRVSLDASRGPVTAELGTLCREGRPVPAEPRAPQAALPPRCAVLMWPSTSLRSASLGSHTVQLSPGIPSRQTRPFGGEAPTPIFTSRGFFLKAQSLKTKGHAHHHPTPPPPPRDVAGSERGWGRSDPQADRPKEATTRDVLELAQAGGWKLGLHGRPDL